MRTTIKPAEVDKRWFTTEDAMTYLGVSRRWLERVRKDAKMKFYKVQGTIFYARNDLDRLVEKNRVI